VKCQPRHQPVKCGVVQRKTLPESASATYAGTDVAQGNLGVHKLQLLNA
jgi:hypothetical protein